MIRRLRHDPTWWFSLQIPFLRAPAACWWARAIVESTDTSQPASRSCPLEPCGVRTYRGSPVPVTGTDGALQLVGLTASALSPGSANLGNGSLLRLG
jgi:hypothetical protein